MTKTYLVGGAVRDEILGIVPKDRDYVVVGSTEQEMIAAGFSKVGADFPVFLHPETGEEYALARRERSTGPGYNDFVVEFSPDVTIEEDLARRDLTMNAIAKDIETVEYIDPFNGIDAINHRFLRNVSPSSFVEDPVRILRLARFAAQFPSFRISPNTIQNATFGRLTDATPERVAAEMIKALQCLKPSRFFDVLRETNQLFHWFEEIDNLIDVPAGSFKWHAEGDSYTHTMMVLDSAARYEEDISVLFGCLVHDLGKALTPVEKWPKHHGHEAAGVEPTHRLCDRLKLSNDLRQAGTLSAKYHMHVHNAYKMAEKGWVNTYDGFRKCPVMCEIVGRVAFHDNEGRLPYTEGYDNHEIFAGIIYHLSTVKLSDDYTPDKIEAMSIETRKNTLHRMRLNSVSKYLRLKESL